METKEYLKRVTEYRRKNSPELRDWPYASFEEFVLKNGREYASHSQVEVKRDESGECFTLYN